MCLGIKVNKFFFFALNTFIGINLKGSNKSPLLAESRPSIRKGRIFIQALIIKSLSLSPL
jgi:hypothetical protein